MAIVAAPARPGRGGPPTGRLPRRLAPARAGQPRRRAPWPPRRRGISPVRRAPRRARAALGLAGRGGLSGGPSVLARRAILAEPMLDFVLFQRSGRLAVSRYLGALLLGRLPRRQDIAIVRAREALVSAAELVPVQADGEIVARLPVRIAIAEQALQLVRP